MRQRNRQCFIGLLLVGASLTFAADQAIGRREASDQKRRQVQRELQEETHRVMGSVCDEILRESTGPIEETLFSPLASSNVKFPTAAGTCEFRLGRRGDARVLLRIQGGREEVLTSSVQRVFRSEAPNAMDDNRNGVIDEGGFWVTSRGNGSVSIGLSLAQLHGDQLVSTSRQVTITPGAPDGW